MSNVVVMTGCMEGIPPLELATAELFINYNNVRVVEREMFKNVRGLMTLSLRSNHLKKINGDSFVDIRPSAIDLECNSLEHIPLGLFYRQTYLQILYLNNNLIKFIDNLAFRDLASLAEIDLSCNRSSHIF